MYYQVTYLECLTLKKFLLTCRKKINGCRLSPGLGLHLDLLHFQHPRRIPHQRRPHARPQGGGGQAAGAGRDCAAVRAGGRTGDRLSVWTSFGQQFVVLK